MAVKRIRSTVDEREQKSLLTELQVVMKSQSCQYIGMNNNNTNIYLFIHNTYHFNLTVGFQNWPLQLTLKITWSLAKIKMAIVK